MSPSARHYLDCNATAPLRPEAREAMLAFMQAGGNPSSVHSEGRAARAMLDTARRQVGTLAGLPPGSIHFTSGGTEANNWALAQGQGGVLVAATAHDSALAKPGAVLLPVDAHGLLLTDVLADHLDATSGALVSVMAVNNETGVIQPLETIQQICSDHGALLHVDAVQVPGKLDLREVTSIADITSISAHKLGGPAGCGALLTRPGLELKPHMFGGGQEQRRRAGTENMVGIVGFGAAAEAVTRKSSAEVADLLALRRRLEDSLLGLGTDIRVYAREAERVANTVCVRMPGVAAETQVMALDLAGVAVSAGSACSSGKVTPSHVLQAMGIDRDEAAQAIRVSLGWASDDSDVDACVAAWTDLWKRKRAA